MLVFSLVISCLAVIADAYTTILGLNSGKYEGADFRRFLIRKLGLNGGTYGVAVAFSCVIILVNLLALDVALGLIVGNLSIAAIFLYAAVKNYKLIKR